MSRPGYGLRERLAPAEAVAIYQRLREINPEDVTARQGLLGARLAAAAADARAGNRSAARESLQELTREFPDLEEAWVGLARIRAHPRRGGGNMA